MTQRYFEMFTCCVKSHRGQRESVNFEPSVVNLVRKVVKVRPRVICDDMVSLNEDKWHVYKTRCMCNPV